MKAAVVDTLGRAPRYTDFPDPQPRDGVVVGRVEAASVKNLDRGLVAGTHYGSAALPLPFVAGMDGVTRLDDGRLVYSGAVAPYGLMAEHTLVEIADAVELPVGMDPVLGAAVPNPGLSASFALEYAANIERGQSVLILGATGVTGSVAAQLAKNHYGAGRVVVAGRNGQRLEWLRDTVADDVVRVGDDLTAQVTALHQSQPFDVVLDYLWGTPSEQVLAALGNTGLSAGYQRTRYVQIGSMAGPTIALPAAILRSAGVEIVGLGLGSISDEAKTRAAERLLPELFTMAAAGTLRIDVQPHPLSAVAEVWSSAAPGGTRVVLVP